MRLNFQFRKIVQAGLALLLFGSLAAADTITVTLSGSGSYSTAQGFNNTDPSVRTGIFAGGFLGVSYSDWLAFNIPNFSGTITGATIRIFNPLLDGDRSIGGASYEFWAESGPVTLSNVAIGTLAGSTPVPVQGGAFVSFDLNSSGLAHLNSSQGNTVFFAGRVPDALTSSSGIFGTFGPDTPLVSLYLTTAPADTPEPGSVLLLGSGLIGLIGAGRKKLASLLGEQG